jgi:cytochrome c
MFSKLNLHSWLYYVLAILVAGAVLYAFGHIFASPNHLPSFALGRKATKVEIKKLDIDVRPDGKGLPPGAGKPMSGLLIYKEKCLSCHGNGAAMNEELPGGRLFTTDSKEKSKTIGSYWPYATTIFDYVRRAMPYNAPGSLTNQEVYHLTAYLLYENKIIEKNYIITQKTLPEIVMPAKRKFVKDNRNGGNQIK